MFDKWFSRVLDFFVVLLEIADRDPNYQKFKRINIFEIYINN